MTERHSFTPRTQEALGRTLEATRNAMAGVDENVRILKEGRERAEKRIEVLEEELAQTKQALAAATSAGKDLHEALKKGAEECAQTSSKLASAARESDRLRKKLEDVRGERDGLVQKSRDFERVLAEKGSLETRLAMAAEVAMAQEEAIAGLEKKLEEA